jgi:hypothetical protein
VLDVNCNKCACASCGPCKANAASAPPAAMHSACSSSSWTATDYPVWAPDRKQKAAANRDTHFGGRLHLPEWEFGMLVVLSFGLCQVAHCAIHTPEGSAAFAEVTGHGGAEVCTPVPSHRMLHRSESHLLLHAGWRKP